MSRRRGDDGVTIVEAAFALPILFMFIMALVDLGLWTYNSNQATNAAKDGARAGIISYTTADQAAGPDRAAIVAAIEAHVPGRRLAPGDLTVSCVRSDGVAVSGGCAAARPQFGDRLKVDVSWRWDLVSPIAGVVGSNTGLSSGTTTMALIGKPVAGTPPVAPPPPPPPSTSTSTSAPPDPTPCSVTGLSVAPSPVSPDNQDRIRGSGLAITYTTNGVELCNGLTVQLTTPGGTVASAVCDVCEVNQNHRWTYSSNDKIWIPGQATARVFNASADMTTTFTVT